MCYAFPNNGETGVTFGDQTLNVGASGFHLSSAEIAKVMVKLNEGALLDPEWLDQMQERSLGIHRRNERFGTAYVKGGFLVSGGSAGDSRVDNGRKEVGTYVFAFSTGVQVGAIVNSNIAEGTQLARVIDAAYDEAWVPVD
jgi:hypothetical protein